jgi:integrase
MPRHTNKGRPRGQATGFSKEQLRQIAGVVANHPRNAALWATAVSTCLRSSDLLALRVRDVTDRSGQVVERFTTNVRKTTNFHAASVRRVTITCYLSPESSTFARYSHSASWIWPRCSIVSADGKPIQTANQGMGSRHRSGPESLLWAFHAALVAVHRLRPDK